MMMEDDSDDELDELLTKRVFRVRKRDKTKGLENLSQETASSLSQETAPLTQETNDAKSPSSRTLLPEEIEVKAQRAIEGLNFPLVEHISRIDQLGWYKTRTKKGKKEATWFPCRKCHPDEGIGLFEKEESRNKILIRYLGYGSEHTGNYDLVSENLFIPLSKGNKETGLENYKEYLNFNPVKLRTEELAIISMWKRVEERESKGGSSNNNKSTKQKDAALCTPPRCEVPAKKKTRKVLVHNEEDESLCSDDDEEEVSSFSKKKELLRDGDTIEYYDPIGVSGNAEWLRRATVLGIDPKSALPLNLSNGQNIDRSIMIKRIKRRFRGTIEDFEGTFKALKDYSLRACGTQELVSIKQMAMKAKEIRAKHAEDVAKFWKEGKTEKLSPASSNLKSHATSQNLRPAEESTTKTVSPNWKIHLMKLKETTEEKLKTKTRFVPSLQPVQLDVIMKVWGILQSHINNSNCYTTKTILPLLAKRLKISERSLDLIMHGDEEKKLSEMNKIEIIECMQEWLLKPTIILTQQNQSCCYHPQTGQEEADPQARLSQNPGPIVKNALKRKRPENP